MLGGYGAMAQVIVRDLVESPQVKQVAVCGRSLRKAKLFVDELRSSKAQPIEVDITDKDRLRGTRARSLAPSLTEWQICLSSPS